METHLLSLSQILGQPLAVKILSHAIQTRQCASAYIFEGPIGVGKASCAKALFSTLCCTRKTTFSDACGSCSSCIKMINNSHPDFLLMDMTSTGLADEVERILQRLAYPPHESPYSMVLIDPADQLSMPNAMVAANRLLKTLEEPASSTIFVLVSSHSYQLLPTIRSRAQRIRFLPIEDAVLESIVFSQRTVSKQLLIDLLPLSKGSVGLTMQILSEEDAWGKRVEAGKNLLSAARLGSSVKIIEASQHPCLTDKNEALHTLSWVMSMIEKMARLQLLQGEEPVWFPCIYLVEEALWALKRHISPSLITERLMRRIGNRTNSSQPQAEEYLLQ